MKPLYLTVEIHAGSTIQEATLKASEIADLLEMDVCFNFNGVHCTMSPHDDPFSLADNYDAQIGTNIKHKHAFSRAIRKSRHDP